MNNARKLIRFKTSGPVVEFAYNEYANAQQRLVFSRQFYGPSFMLAAGAHRPLAQVNHILPSWLRLLYGGKLSICFSKADITVITISRCCEEMNSYHALTKRVLLSEMFVCYRKKCFSNNINKSC